jgi:AraC family transcriptional regulator
MEKIENMRDSNQEKLNRLQASFQAIWEQEDLFQRIIEFFPYPIQVYARDGTTVMVNRAMLREFGVPSKDLIIGRYNVFQDPDISKAGLSDLVKDVFRGKTRSVKNIKVPLQSIKKRYRIQNLDMDYMYQDATGFPIRDEQGEVSHVVVLLITRKVYKGKVNIGRAIEYLENNWNKEYNINEAAKAANLSPYHFSRVFKREIGITPYNYYQKLKVHRLQEKLRDANLTVKEAFESCGLEYCGHTIRVFKKHVGVTPLKYREMAGK